MSRTVGTRQAQKQQSRRALLDAGLRLLEWQNLSGLGLRELAREAGLSPAGFYRHFRDLPDLGVALVGESLAELHAMIRAAFDEQVAVGGSDPDLLIDRAVEAIVEQVQAQPALMRFVARERYGGVRVVRETIAAELDRFVDEVAGALAAQPVSAGWTPGDVQMLAALYVDLLVRTAAALVDAPDAAEWQRIAECARRQLRLISVGRRHWTGHPEN